MPLYISEYHRSGIALNGQTLAAGEEPSITTQKITISGASAQSSAFSANTKFIRVHTSEVCSITFGSNPTATAAHARLAAGQTEYFSVFAGQKVAVITNT